MYNNIRRNVIRAVKVLPEAVRVGMADIKLLENEHAFDKGSHENELDLAQNKISSLQSQIKLLANKLESSMNNYEELSSQFKKTELELVNRETVLQAEMQSKLEIERQTVTKEARLEASTILEEAEKTRSEAFDKGYSEGFIKGQNEGLEKAKAEVEEEYKARFADIISIFEKIHAEIENNFKELIQLNDARLLRLWKETLSAMLNREVELNPDTARMVLEGIMERVSDKNRILIYLSPFDIGNIQFQTDKMTESLRGIKHLEFLPDARVERGSCIVETNLGIYDARWRLQLEQIEIQIADLYREVSKESTVEPDKTKSKTKRKKKGAIEE
ncbi:MAG: FliH/SctL family protein [Synergistaceae bacterium]|nr:FliH/SctL family protein [Synergistaceae bacterium]